MKCSLTQKSITTVLVFLFTLTINAQETITDLTLTSEYHHAYDLFTNKMYSGAQKLFQNISKKAGDYKNIKADADYYDAICAIRLDQKHADDKVLAFVENHPTSTKKQQAFLNVADYYFANRKAAHALKWYEKVNSKSLEEGDLNEMNFKMGYAMLVSGYLKEAKAKYKTLLSDPRFGDDARYYYGYISYEQNNYGEAEDNLSQLANNATYQGKATYYLLDISFKNGKFDKAIETGLSYLPKAEKHQKSDINKVIGESYFNLGKYKEAIPYLKKYEGKKGKWNNTDFYYLGYSYYKQEKYNEAINYFNKIISADDKIAQNAYYHLGECYLKANKKGEALNAFKKASELTFDKEISDDAAFNYTKLSYEEGNPYKSAPEVLKDFIAKHPTSKHIPEINRLLITSYLFQKDYQGAIDYLNLNRNPENNKLANEVSLYRGIQLFNQQKLRESIPHFLIASSAENKKIAEKAKFWMAETEYRLGNYKNALKEFSSIENVQIEDTKHLNYNIAYTYYKLKNYERAAVYFKKYLDSNPDDYDMKDDATIRLGDSYFAEKKYNNAVNAYNKVINDAGVGADYAQYQKAMSIGLSGNTNEKINNLLAVIDKHENSNLKDDALFELAKTYTTTKNHSKAHNSYDKLIKEYPKSSYVSSSLLRQGLLYYNDNLNNEALQRFKRVVSDYPNSSEAKQAVSNARNVYINMGKVEEYANWVKNIKFINVSNADLDNATYESAENKFLENNTEKALEGFHKYLTAFPNGIHSLKANFYLAQTYLKTNQKTQAIPHYKFVINKNQNEFSEESLVKLSEIYLKNEKSEEALPLLVRLEQEANQNQNIIYAQSNLMKLYYDDSNYKKAVDYAEKVMFNSKATINAQEDAKIIIARAAFKTGDLEKAQEYFYDVELKATGKLKAEALYHKALFLHIDKLYNDSNKVVQDVIANYSSYKYWGVKSYIIMAKNHYALKDAYQATYILENIIKNFDEFPDLIEEANNELRTIKNKEAKTNESVNKQ